MNSPRLIKIACLLLLQYCCTEVFSQNSVSVYRIDEDNPQLKITKLYKNEKGLIYAGTNHGIYKFDGLGFMKLPLPDSLNKKNVTAILDDGNTLWIGLQNGHIWQIHNRQANPFNPEEGLPNAEITDIIKDKQNRIWFSTGGEGIYIYDKRLYNINTDDSLTDDYVYDLEPDENGNILAGTDRGLNICSFKDGRKTIRKFTSSDGLTDNIVREVKRAGNNYFILGLQDKGLFEIRFNTNGSIEYRNSFPNWNYGQVNAMAIQNNNLLAATESGLFQLMLPAGGSHFFLKDSLSHFNKLPSANGNITHTVVDNENNFWFCSATELVKTFGNKLVLLVPGNENDSQAIHSLFACNNNYLWAGSNNKVMQYSIGGQEIVLKKTIPVSSIAANNEITSLYCSHSGLLWIGTVGSGVILLDAKTGQYRSITEEPVLKNASILSISGKDSTVWISFLGGAVHCTTSGNHASLKDRFHFTGFGDISGIGSSYIYYIYTDSKKRVWFATDGKGITLLEEGRFRNFNKKNGLKSEVIYSVAEDKRGHIWFSTMDAGLYEYDGNKFTNYNNESGLSDLNILSINTDEKGNIIIFHPRSVDILNPVTGNISYIDKDWGIAGIGNNLNATSKDSSGNIYVNTSAGLYRINTGEFADHNKPVVLLESVSLFLKPVETGQTKRFAYDENNFSFSFAGIYYSDPEKMRYQYMLEGFNNQWISTRDKVVNFPRLPTGDYTFRVRVSLNDNFENASEDSYSFTIRKPFWRAWWFIALFVIAAFLLLRFIIKQREKRLQKWDRLEKEKAQFQYETLKNQVNPHFLFNSFNTLISVIEENPENAGNYVQHLSDFYRSIVNFREKDLISLSEEIDLISNYFFIQQKRYGSNLVVHIRVSGTEKKDLLIPPLTLQLLAENAVKHNAVSKETPLIFEVFIENNMLIARNNLNEKINKEAGEGLGLQNIMNRYQLISGRNVEIKKTETHFTVSLPLIKPMI